MGRRKGELTAVAIDRGWPHQVAVPATECRGSLGRFMDAFCLDLSVCERHYSVFHEDKWWIVYCFADPEHAEKFASLDAALLEPEAAPVQSRYLAGRVSGMAAHKNTAAIKAAVARLRNPAQWPNV